MIQKLEPRHFGPDSGFGGATFSDVIDKVNEIIDAMNGEHDPADIYSEDGRLIAKKDESEDERMIRKIEMFLSAYGADYFSNDEWREIEDWLEKQKEPTKEELYAEAGTTEKEYIANTMKMVRAMREKKQEQKPISSCDIVPYIDEKIAALQDMWREEKVSFDWDDMKDMIEDVARHFYHKEQKPSTGIYWHAIKRGDKIPCRAYLYKVAYETENNFGGRATIDGLLVPNIENVTCGCDTWYLPADDVKNLPREGLDELQKENPKSADSIPADCVSDVKCDDRWHKVTDSLPDNPREVLCKDEAGNYFIGRYYVGEGWEISNYDDEDKPHHLNPPVSKWIDLPSEKQKEQKPNSTEDMPYIADERFYEREPADSFKYKLAEYMTKRCTKKEGPYGYSYSISSESILELAKEELIKRGVVQKPAEWSEFDKGVLKDAICAADILGNDESFNKGNPNLGKAFRVAKDWLKALPERFNLQPKPEWSEEDKQWLSEVYFAIDHSMYSEVERQAMKKYIDYLRYQSQPKQEWSEDDKGILLSVKCVIDEVWHSKNNTTDCPANELEEMWHWLDTLWQRVEYPQPSWKPSEEQMDALAYAIQILDDGLSPKAAKAGEELEHLREQLKKL